MITASIELRDFIFYAWLLLTATVIFTFIFYHFLKVYYLAPSRIRHRFWLALNPDLKRIEITDLPSLFQDTFASIAKQLQALGFQAIAHFQATKDAGYVHAPESGFESIWLNPVERTFAQVMIYQVKPSPINVDDIVDVVLFYTEFDDSRSLGTNNSSLAQIYPPVPGHDSLACKGIDDLSKLFEIHRTRIKQASKNTHAVLPPAGGEIELYRKRVRENYEYRIAIGEAQRDESGTRIVPTWRGARAMVKRVQPKSKREFWRSEEHRLQRILTEEGMGTLDDFLPPR
jgi:hypothetical protein